MRKLLIQTISLAFACMLCYSCSSKQSPVNELEDLAYELSENADSYDADEWQEVIEKYQKIEEDLNNYEYTDEELKEIGRLKGKCFAAFTKSSAKILKGAVHNWQMQMEGASEEMEDALKDIENIFSEE